MIAIISPAKSLDFDSKPEIKKHTQPAFLNEAKRVNERLKQLGETDLIKLMGISAKLAKLNVVRNLSWTTPFNSENAKQAVFAFNGDVYEGMQATYFSEEQADFAQNHIRILSGLYGLLKPLDLIQPYRLEMGTKLAVNGNKDLYQFWQSTVTKELNKQVNADGGKLINLASAEYFKAVDLKKFTGTVITPEFKDNKDGKYKIISFYAKKARGLMCRFIVQNKIKDPEHLKAFDLEGYYFNNDLSEGNNWVFTRDL